MCRTFHVWTVLFDQKWSYFEADDIEWSKWFWSWKIRECTMQACQILRIVVILIYVFDKLLPYFVWNLDRSKNKRKTFEFFSFFQFINLSSDVVASNETLFIIIVCKTIKYLRYNLLNDPFRKVKKKKI